MKGTLKIGFQPILTILLEHCKFLTTLKLGYLDLTPAHTQHAMESFQNLDELHLVECWGITSNVNKIGEAKIYGTSNYFFDYCTSVSRLYISLILCEDPEYDSIGSIITDRFPKLERLDLRINLNDNSMAIIEQHLLKDLFFDYDTKFECINAKAQRIWSHRRVDNSYL